MRRGYWGALVALLTALSVALGVGLMGAGRGAAQSTVVRVAMVNTPDDLFRTLAPDFEAQSGLRATITYVGEDPWDEARAGKADLVIAHYGHHGTEPFMMDGLGYWPQMVFANQQVIVGPPSDPAGVRSAADARDAVRRIVEKGSAYVTNNTSGIGYLEDVLFEEAGLGDRGGWYVDLGLQGRPAMEAAAERGAYAMGGLVPFLRAQRQRPLGLEMLVTGDAVLQRVMVAVVVREDRVAGVNVAGAQALGRWLVEPATQAKIAAFRYAGLDVQAWWPAGRHNSAVGRE
jgi:tungstate transport system substrate-binding protein